jgi:hypothetical protein
MPGIWKADRHADFFDGHGRGFQQMFCFVNPALENVTLDGHAVRFSEHLRQVVPADLASSGKPADADRFVQHHIYIILSRLDFLFKPG